MSIPADQILDKHVRPRSASMHEVPAGVAQQAEQPSCKRQVSGSTPLTGSTEVFTFHQGPCSRLHLTFSAAGAWVLPFFFFQAEDGIRDPLVTGVQTCALPI